MFWSTIKSILCYTGIWNSQHVSNLHNWYGRSKGLIHCIYMCFLSVIKYICYFIHCCACKVSRLYFIEEKILMVWCCAHLHMGLVFIFDYNIPSVSEV